MVEFITKILSCSANRKWDDKDIELVDCVLKQCYLLSKEVEEIRPSCVAFKNCFKWGGTIENSLSSALLTLNSKHGPFTNCYDLINIFFEKSLAKFEEDVIIDIAKGKIIPGFGKM
jgi:hypothetical protein